MTTKVQLVRAKRGDEDIVVLAVEHDRAELLRFVVTMDDLALRYLYDLRQSSERRVVVPRFKHPTARCQVQGRPGIAVPMAQVIDVAEPGGVIFYAARGESGELVARGVISYTGDPAELPG